MCKQIQDRLDTYTTDKVWDLVQTLASNPYDIENADIVFEVAIDNLHDRLHPIEFVRLMNKVEEIQHV